MADDIDMEKPAEKVTVNNDCVMKSEKMFSLKRWNAVAMWSWDVECEICAICRVQVMEYKIRTIKMIRTLLGNRNSDCIHK
ncbi:hypothetical protein OUZ56_014022 [Daphnia magna]|uniref:RING-box protein 2 n=1 Tax=Daphnia magna TaxID=35525 RepID=A0ABQ9Z7M7_9CRUS|nr:hypothetical protein OUZ56_014022 [Daphnia magna]